MSIKRAPLKSDPAGKCSRWHVRIYNPETKKEEWHTVHGPFSEAQKLEREFENEKEDGTYVCKGNSLTVRQVYDKLIRHLTAKNRRTSTITGYQYDLEAILLKFGERIAKKMRKHDINDHLTTLRTDEGYSTSELNKTLRATKRLMNFAFDEEIVSRQIMARVKPFERAEGEKTVNRAAYTEEEMGRIIAACTPRELALIGLLTFGGPRPGEVYALDCEAVDVADLDAATVAIKRSWDHRGKKFVYPKTKAGNRIIPISPWLAAALKAQIEGVGGKGLVFPSGVRDPASRPVCEQALELYEQGVDRNEIARRFDSTPIRITQLICHERKRRRKMAEVRQKPTLAQKPLNPSNCRRDVWIPLKKRAEVRDLDLYSLRWTFASMARASGEFDFNVARALGQAKSKIVDTIYAQTMASGLAGISRKVTERVLGKPSANPPQPPTTPTPTPPAAAAELAELAKRMQELLAQVQPHTQRPAETAEKPAPGRPALSLIQGGKRDARRTRENRAKEKPDGTTSR